jgi:hypothetical protein
MPVSPVTSPKEENHNIEASLGNLATLHLKIKIKNNLKRDGDVTH